VEQLSNCSSVTKRSSINFDMNRFEIAQCYPTHFSAVRAVILRGIQQRHGRCLKNYFQYRSSSNVVAELKFVYILNACVSPTTFRILISVMSKRRYKLHLCIYEMVKFRTWAIYVGYSESKYRLRISLAHPRDCHFAHVQ